MVPASFYGRFSSVPAAWSHLGGAERKPCGSPAVLTPRVLQYFSPQGFSAIGRSGDVWKHSEPVQRRFGNRPGRNAAVRRNIAVPHSASLGPIKIFSDERDPLRYCLTCCRAYRFSIGGCRGIQSPCRGPGQRPYESFNCLQAQRCRTTPLKALSLTFRSSLET